MVEGNNELRQDLENLADDLAVITNEYYEKSTRFPIETPERAYYKGFERGIGYAESRIVDLILKHFTEEEG